MLISGPSFPRLWQVFWRQEGRPGVWSTGEEVIIPAVARETRGVYSCTAHNQATTFIQSRPLYNDLNAVVISLDLTVVNSLNLTIVQHLNSDRCTTA